MMHQGNNYPASDALLQCLDKQLSEFGVDEHFHNLQWETKDRATLLTVTPAFEE